MSSVKKSPRKLKKNATIRTKIAKLNSAKFADFGPVNRENLFRENLCPRKFMPLRYSQENIFKSPAGENSTSPWETRAFPTVGLRVGCCNRSPCGYWHIPPVENQGFILDQIKILQRKMLFPTGEITRWLIQFPLSTWPTPRENLTFPPVDFLTMHKGHFRHKKRKNSQGEIYTSPS